MHSNRQIGVFPAPAALVVLSQQAIDRDAREASPRRQGRSVTTPPAVELVIINWNTRHLLRDCLTALAGARHDGYSLGQLIVVENASSDGSATDLHPAGLPLSVIRNADNRGFAAACNQVAARCSADYLLFLNPDTTV